MTYPEPTRTHLSTYMHIHTYIHLYKYLYSLSEKKSEITKWENGTNFMQNLLCQHLLLLCVSCVLCVFGKLHSGSAHRQKFKKSIANNMTKCTRTVSKMLKLLDGESVLTRLSKNSIESLSTCSPFFRSKVNFFSSQERTLKWSNV